jgi:hypothetical protein
MSAHFFLASLAGLRVLDSDSGAEALADQAYGDFIYGLAFAPDGSLIAASVDGSIRRYGPDLRLTVKRAATAGKFPFAVAIDPAGRRVAVGYHDAPHVSILDAVSASAPRRTGRAAPARPTSAASGSRKRKLTI